MNIGSAIKEIRKQQKITQSQLSEKTGISQTSLSKIEVGTIPTTTNLKKICKALNIPMSLIYIMSMEEIDIPSTKKAKFNLLYPTIKNLVFELIDISKE